MWPVLGCPHAHVCLGDSTLGIVSLLASSFHSQIEPLHLNQSYDSPINGLVFAHLTHGRSPDKAATVARLTPLAGDRV